MLFINDFQLKEIVMYRGCRAEITKIETPRTLCIRNIEYPKGDWQSARLDYSNVEKTNEGAGR